MALPTLQEIQSKFNGTIIECVDVPENLYIVLDESISLDDFFNLANKYSNVLLLSISKINSYEIDEFKKYDNMPYIIALFIFINNQLFLKVLYDNNLVEISDKIHEKYKEIINKENEEKLKEQDNYKQELATILKNDSKFMSIKNNPSRQAYVQKEYKNLGEKCGILYTKSFIEFYNLYIK